MSALVGCAASASTAPPTGLLLNVKSCPPLLGAGPCSIQVGMPLTETDSSRRSSSNSHQSCLIAELNARTERAREFLRRPVITVSSFARHVRHETIQLS